METTTVTWGYIGIMEKKVETTLKHMGVIYGQWKRKWKLLYSIWGLYMDSGKENGNYFIAYGGYIWTVDKKMEITL